MALALSGTFALSEGDPRWYEALKNTRVLPVTYLHHDDACRFFAKPAPDFPDGVYDGAALERVIHLTNGHPLLLHQIGEAVISAYNRSREAGRSQPPHTLPITAALIDAAIPATLNNGEIAFSSIWQWAVKVGVGVSDDEALTAQLLRAVAQQQPVARIGDPVQRAEILATFCERALLMQTNKGGYAFQVPLIAQWIASKRSLPQVSP